MRKEISISSKILSKILSMIFATYSMIVMRFYHDIGMATLMIGWAIWCVVIADQIK